MSIRIHYGLQHESKAQKQERLSREGTYWNGDPLTVSLSAPRDSSGQVKGVKCPECPLRFKNQIGVITHRSKKHKYRKAPYVKKAKRRDEGEEDEAEKSEEGEEEPVEKPSEEVYVSPPTRYLTLEEVLQARERPPYTEAELAQFENLFKRLSEFSRGFTEVGTEGAEELFRRIRVGFPLQEGEDELLGVLLESQERHVLQQREKFLKVVCGQVRTTQEERNLFIGKYMRGRVK